MSPFCNYITTKEKRLSVMKGKKKKGTSVVQKLKKGALFGIVTFFIVGIALNSVQFTEYKDSVYSNMKEKYIQKEETYSVENLNNDTKKLEKNLILTTDSDLRTPSNVTAEDINKMLEGTALYGMGESFVKAEKQYGVNALYIVGLACLESAYGTSSFAVNRNNLYGWNAVDSNPDKATSFKSRDEATMVVARALQKNYLTEGGAYFEGYTARDIDVHYCTDKKHADKIVNIVSELTKKLG